MSTADVDHIAEPDMSPDTVWVEQVSWIDRVPRSVSMLFVFAVFIGFLGTCHQI